jgi:hypothetical protein
VLRLSVELDRDVFDVITVCWKMPAFGSWAFWSHEILDIHTFTLNRSLVTFTLVI